MVQKTKLQTYLVQEKGTSSYISSSNTHLWLKSLEGADRGEKFSISLNPSDYTETKYKRLTNLTTNDVIDAILFREDFTEQWKVEQFEKISEV